MSPSTQVRLPAAEADFVEIPATGLRVSRAALGTWAMGGALLEGRSLGRVDRRLIEGILDTAIFDPVGPEFMAPPQRP